MSQDFIDESAEQLLKSKIVEKAWQDAAFKEKLLRDPKSAIQESFGVTIPEHISLKAVEETPTEFYLVIPPNPADMPDEDDGPVDRGAW